jgi:KipI family sensor histidine kinase inhibitor
MTEPAPSSADWPRFLPSGDHAITVELGAGVDRAVSARVVRLHRHLRNAPLDGVIETLPSFRSLLVQFDPRRTDPAALEEGLRAAIAGLTTEPLPSRRWTIPVCYAAEMAPDLAELAALCGMSEAQVVECQCSVVYYVYMLGFLPGYGYLGDVPEPLRLPRRTDPRTRVPAGSLAIATGFASVYPFESPGGWHIIGRSPVTFFDADAAEPALLAPGDAIRFEPISAERFDALRGVKPAAAPAQSNGAGL